MKYAVLFIVAISGGGCLYIRYLQQRLGAAMAVLEAERTRQRSLSASYGRITEQWIPFSERYPYDSQNFRFLGSPVDGVQFEEDAVIFIEFKTNRAELSTTQRRIRKNIQEGRVYWEEHVFEDGGPDRR